MKRSPLHKYKQNIIIEQAKELLKNTNKTVTYIAEILGFENNPLYFNRLFKSLTGVPPATYRKKVKANQINIKKKRPRTKNKGV